MQAVLRKQGLEAEKGLHYGIVLTGIAVWHQFGLEQIINEILPASVRIPVSRSAIIQTANRLPVPSSKLSFFRWYDWCQIPIAWPFLPWKPPFGILWVRRNPVVFTPNFSVSHI